MYKQNMSHANQELNDKAQVDETVLDRIYKILQDYTMSASPPGVGKSAEPTINPVKSCKSCLKKYV